MMNKNILRIAKDSGITFGSLCTGEWVDDITIKTFKKYSELLVKEVLLQCNNQCQSEIPTSVIASVISDFSEPNLDKISEFHDHLSEQASWKDVPESEWFGYIAQCSCGNMIPISEDSGTHCYNEVYEFSQYFIDITYQYGHPDPVSITRKMK
jgi:hypothetical protein